MEEIVPQSVVRVFEDLIIQLSRRGKGGPTVRQSTSQTHSGQKRPRDLKNEVFNRSAKRRKRDDRRRDDEDDSPGSIRHTNLRKSAALCYAFNVHTGQFYVGYSGPSGLVVPERLEGKTNQTDRRYGRVEPVMRRVRQDRYLQRRPEHCAEVSALSVATSWGERVQDLIFITIHTTGIIMNPCQHCIQWILPRAYGYFGLDRLFHAGQRGG